MIHKFRMHIRPKKFTNPIFNQTDQVKAHLVFIRESVRLQAYYRPVISNPYKQRASAYVEECRNRL